MVSRRTLAIGAVVVAAAIGTTAAIAASSRDDAKQAQSAILADAAKRLGVTSDQLQSALAGAEDAQLDQAVKDGVLTQAQADAIKARRKADGLVLGAGPLGGRSFGGRGPGGHGFFGPGFARGSGPLDAAAKALGLTTADLLTKLRAGKTLAQVTSDQGKDLADVKAAVKAAETTALDAAVTAGRLTSAQRDKILQGFDSRFDDLANGKIGGGRGGRGPFGGPGGHWSGGPGGSGGPFGPGGQRRGGSFGLSTPNARPS